LRSLDNALLTPHIAYVSDRLYQDAIADIAAFVSGSHIRVIG
jgi:phosphoglycerate dehydrogenase-like enzyme